MVRTKLYRLIFHLAVIYFATSLPYNTQAQSKIDSLLNKLDPQKLAATVAKKTQKLEEKIIAKSEKTLAKLQSQEEKLYTKMLKGSDSLIAKEKLAEIKNRYSELKAKLKTPAIAGSVRQYVPQLDSLGATFKFLSDNNIGGSVKEALSKTTALQNRFQQAEEVRAFIKSRREQLKAQLEKMGMVKELKQINKQIFYYSAQIKEYREILKDPKKIEKKALELLSQTKIWRDFFRRNSMLSSLFRLQDPDEPLTMASLAGLQTRSQVQALVQQQIQSAGPNGAQLFQQQMASAQGQLKTLQNKILKGGGGSSDADMPEGFRPNPEKTKSFLQRLEYSTSLQTQKGNSFWPNNADLSLNVGYKINERSVAGIGAAYTLGLGRGWNAIRFSNEGLVLKNFIDWKINRKAKNVFWLTGGMEMRYRTAFNSVAQLRNMDAWQKSALFGLSKSVPIKSKFFEKTKVQILWDMLAKSQVPKGQSLIVRVGYSFK